MERAFLIGALLCVSLPAHAQAWCTWATVINGQTVCLMHPVTPNKPPAIRSNTNTQGDWWQIQTFAIKDDHVVHYPSPQCDPADESPAGRYEYEQNMTHATGEPDPTIKDLGNGEVVVTYYGNGRPHEVIFYRGRDVCMKVLQERFGAEKNLDKYR